MDNTDLKERELIPPWIHKFVQPPVLLLWKSYYVLVIRSIALKHWLKGEIPFSQMINTVRPGGLKPGRFYGEAQVQKRYADLFPQKSA